jgi:hypothetical protein
VGVIPWVGVGLNVGVDTGCEAVPELQAASHSRRSINGKRRQRFIGCVLSIASDDISLFLFLLYVSWVET